jgi:glycosyltransferase involved in cell wall biosynthesis
MSTLHAPKGLRVCIITGIFPPDIGGPATYVPHIAAALAERGHSITVLTLSDCLEHDDSQYGFRVMRLPRRLSKPWRWLRTVREILRLGQDADVLFVNGLAIEAVLANLWLGKPMVQKVVGDLAWERATNRGWVRDGFEEFQKHCYGLKVEGLKALRAWWTRRASQVIVPSRYLADWVTRWGVPAETMAVIYNAVESFDGVRPAVVPLRTPLKVVTVGRLVSLKCVDRVIKALISCPTVGLVIVGDGSERKRLEDLTNALGIADRVYFTGQVSHVETRRLMAACDFFVLNSTHEGLPHVVLEAMSLGLPVVATAVGGTPEVVCDGHNGRLIGPRDDDALVQVLAQLVSSPGERQRLARGAQQTVVQFGFQHLVEATEAVLWESAQVRKTRLTGWLHTRQAR